jgi:hypothetical protein
MMQNGLNVMPKCEGVKWGVIMHWRRRIEGGLAAWFRRGGPPLFSTFHGILPQPIDYLQNESHLAKTTKLQWWHGLVRIDSA